ncbi:MAG: cytochrome c peroxidase [Chromatiales bacterium]|jgi:cytochrome c peroxidase
MNIGNLPLWTVALVTLLVGLGVLIFMVRYDLGPSSRLARGGQWLLATALGTGVLAFGLKLAIIATIVSLPELAIDPLIEKPAVQVQQGPHDPLQGFLASQQLRWQALPGVTAAAVTELPDIPDRDSFIWQALPEQAPNPPGNPSTPAKVALGERLFFDSNLSLDRSLSCASCHDVEGGSGDDGRATSIGIDNQKGGRNAPTVWNAAFQAVLFWDGRADSLEAQAKGPLVNPIEMGMPSHDLVVERVLERSDYLPAFEAAFGRGVAITIDRIAESIAAYERTLITSDTPYDRFVRGDLGALTPAQLRGMHQFQRLGCVQCHFGPNFSGASLFDSKAPLRIFPVYPTPYEAKYGLTQDSGASEPGSGRGIWRVPTLRNVALTGPWFHNGSVTDLAEAVRIMASVQLGYTGRYLVWSDSHKAMVELDRPTINDETVEDLVAFLYALSSDRLVARLAAAEGDSEGGIGGVLNGTESMTGHTRVSLTK